LLNEKRRDGVVSLNGMGREPDRAAGSDRKGQRKVVADRSDIEWAGPLHA